MNQPPSQRSNNQSGQKKSSQRNHRRGKRPGQEGSKGGQGQSQQGQGNRRPPSHGRNRNRRRPTQGQQQSGFDKVQKSYLNLLDKHIEARRKYFEFYYRADPRQLIKLEKNFYRTLEEMNEYIENLRPEYKQEFQEKYDGLDWDTTYTSNRNMDPKPEPVTQTGEFEDPHLLPAQRNSQYAEDTEESSGTMDDYLKYKGL